MSQTAPDGGIWIEDRGTLVPITVAILNIARRLEEKMATLAEAVDRLRSYLAGQGSLTQALADAQATIQAMTDADAAEDANYEATIADLTQQLSDQVSQAQAAADDITAALDAVADPGTGGQDPGSVDVGELPTDGEPTDQVPPDQQPNPDDQPHVEPR